MGIGSNIGEIETIGIGRGAMRRAGPGTLGGRLFLRGKGECKGVGFEMGIFLERR